MPKRLTIKDIARLSGTGKSTVSRVLNQQGDVHPETRKRIEAVINEYQFTPSRPARSMRVKESRVIGIIMARLDSAAENQAVSAMLPLLYRHGYDVLILESRFSTDKVTEHLTVLKQREVDGAILFSFTGLTAGMIAGWEPHMVLMVHPCDGFSSVCYDDAGAVQMLADHLFQQGHRRISYLGVNQSDKTTGEDRYLAYLAACKRLSLTPSPLWEHWNITVVTPLPERSVAKVSPPLSVQQTPWRWGFINILVNTRHNRSPSPLSVIRPY